MKYTSINLEETIVALATPQGTGAIGVVRLSGSNAIKIANQFFPSKDLSKQETHSLHYGTFRDGKEIIDQVLISIFKAPRSYTGQEVVEISCHGSDYILQRVIKLCIDAGARTAQAGEFTMRAFLAGKMDLSQAEAVADLIASDSQAAHELAIKQMRGGFSSQIKELREELVKFASLVELELDFGEEDVEFADRTQLVNLISDIQQLIRTLLDSFELGNAIKNGVTTVIAGRPNAGKSTLLNALLNEDRAIVSSIAGTTRDTIEEVINLNGIPFRFIDTAGIREASDTIEAIGVEKTMQKIKQSAIVLYLFDLATMTADQLKADVEHLRLEEVPLLLVGNKLDEVEASKIKAFEHLENILFISSREKQELDKLKMALTSLILDRKVSSSDTIITNIRHYDALQQTDQALQKVMSGISNNLSGELLALDIRAALDYLGLVTGEVTTDDLLGSIFSSFCIGK